MRIFFDTEFIEDGKTIDLLSIGMIREDGRRFYAENSEADRSRASDWVRENVFPFLKGGRALMARREIAKHIREFAGYAPEFWAYYADYDWVALCQLYGTMMDLPEGWPMFCMDVKQAAVMAGNPQLPPEPGDAHNALADACWTFDAWQSLNARPA